MPLKKHDSGNKLCDSSETSAVNFETEGIEKDFALKTGFRGFEKEPLILISPINITPYLPTIKSNVTNNDFSIHKHRLSQKCLVMVRRDNLENLMKSSSNPNFFVNNINKNMNDFKCTICDKEYTSERRLQNHQENKHMIVSKSSLVKTQKRVSFSDHVIVHEVMEYHKCRKCCKIFRSYKLLKAHMKENHKKRRRYICDYCNKKFMDRMFFKVHIRLHCDVCKLALPNRGKYLEHRRNVCRIIKLHNCKICKLSFFKIMDLKDHSYEHINTYFICDICKDQFETKCLVSHHISFLHSSTRPTSLYTICNMGNDRLYLCNFCDESSVERFSIEKHVEILPDLSNRAMTGYKDHYFCDQCLKKFKTEADMLHHKWSHFLKNSDNSQIRRKRSKTESNGIINIKEFITKQPKVVVEKLDFNNQKSTKKKGITKNLHTIKNNRRFQDDEIEMKNAKNITEQEIMHTDNNNKKIEDIISNDTDLTGVQEMNPENKQIDPVIMIDKELTKPVIDPKSKKTIISRFQCQHCDKYYSSNYCLNRHVESQHSNYVDLQCKVCEETFVWPSLLHSHKCIRLNLPEMPFDDARPEIHFDNLHESHDGFDDFNISENDNYMNSIDFEIPAPIVELTEYDNVYLQNNLNSPLPQPASVDGSSLLFQNVGYKVVMQEVPIEF